MKGMDKFIAAVIVAHLFVTAILVACYGATFVRWNLSSNLFCRLDNVMAKVPVILVIAGVVLLVAGAFLSRMFGIGLPAPSKFISTAFGWTALLVVLLVAATAFTHKRIPLAVEGTEARVKQQGRNNWETVTPEHFEETARHNLRRHVVFTMIGLLLCTAAFVAQPRKGDERGSKTSAVESQP